MKKVAIGLGAVVFIVLAVALLAPFFVDLNDFKPDIAREVEAATGRKLVISGDIDARVLPSPGATVRGIRFANIEGATAADMATLQSVEIDLALGPLLSGKIQIRSITLVKPVIAIEVLADGRSNLDFAAPGSAGSDSGAAADASKDTAGPAIRIDRVAIEQGAISYTDAKSGETIQVDGFDATLSAASLKGPFAGVGEFNFRKVPINFAISTGRLAGPGAVSMSAEIGIGGADAKLTFRGQASEPTAEAHVTGKLQFSGGNFGGLLTVLNQLAGQSSADLPKIAQAYSFAAAVDATSRDIALNDLVLELGNSNASGAISAALGAQMRLDVALSVNRFDADALLLEIGSAAPAGDAAKETAMPAKAAPDAPRISFALPENLNGSVIVEVEALTFRKNVVRRAAIDAEIENGTVKLQRLAAQFPGGSDVSVAGTLTTVDRAPQFEGSIRASSDNIRGVFDWLEIDTKSIAVDRLRKLALSSRVRVTPDVAQIYDIDLTLDSTKLTGGVAYAFRARPSFSVDATVDRLNIDAYLPKPPGDDTGAAKQEASTLSAEKKPAGGPLAVLDTFDTNLKLAAGSLTYNELAAQGLKVDLSLLGGELTVRELRTTNFAGVAATLSARGRNFAKDPAIAADFNVTIANPSRTAQIAQLGNPMIARLGKLSAKGSISGSAKSLALNTTLDVEGMRAVASGTVNGLGLGIGAESEKPAFDLSLNLTSPNITAFVKRFDPAVALDIKGPIEMIGKVKGGLEALDVDIALSAAGAQFNAAGRVEPLAGPQYNVQLALSHPDVVKFLDNVGVDYRPAATNLGGISLKSAVQGGADKIRLTGMDGKLGPARFSGDVSIGLAGVRPRVDANVRTSEILLDLFLPRAETGRSGTAGKSRTAVPGTASQQRWSREPIDFSFAQAIDGSIQIASRGIVWGAYNFVEPQLKLVIEDGVIDVNPLLGKLFSGEVQLAARLTTANTPRLGLSLNLKGADLAAAVKQAAQIDILTGFLDLQGQFTALGRNQFEIISTLAGEGTAAGRDGSVDGIDLRSLSDRLKRLNEVTDYLSLLQSSMAGGTTKYQTVGGAFAINRGIVTAKDMRAQLDAAEGVAQAKIDLPRWNLDLTSRFRLTEHANAPTIGLDLRGPIDAPRREVRTL
ncbi:MAG: AsmA family protein [Proteobacteria bacterium]|nr:AsmA family protein [Pseudomonadota bacterium]